MRAPRVMRVVSLFAVGGLALGAAACGEAPEENNGGGSAGEKYGACMVTDTGGIDDKSFNAGAWAGLQAAKQAQSNVEPKYVASAAEADYEPNLTQFVNQKCDFILAVGGLMGDATKKIAQAHPDQAFGIVDSKIPDVNNVYPMQFDTAQAAFLAGYLAAGYSKSGVVGTYGGMKIAPVTIFMDGFADGVAHYNKTKNKKVKVLGWDKAAQNGTFAEKFDDQAKGKAITQTFVAQGADVIMPVAGGTGLGTASAAQESGKFAVIWVDSDGCESAAQYCSVFLSTVEKNIPGAVEQAVIAGAKGEQLDNTTGYVGTLANEGVSLAPYHEFDDKVPAELKAEIDKLKADIVAGTIKVESPSSPTK